MLYLDRDNTLFIDRTLELMPGAEQALATLESTNTPFSILTNKGYLNKTDPEFIKERDASVALLSKLAPNTFTHYHALDAACPQKPNVQSLEQEAVIIGDKVSDLETTYGRGVLLGQQHVNNYLTSERIDDAVLWAITPFHIRSKIVPLNAVLSPRETYPLITGAFDILHPGHIAILNQYRPITVGLNTDASVRSYKGQPRHRQMARAIQLASLHAVSRVILFDESEPSDLIDRLCPQTYILSAEYDLETSPEYQALRQIGSKVIQPARIGNFSSSCLKS